MTRIPKRAQPPRAVALIRAEIAKLMQCEDPNRRGEKIGSGVGIYAYFDYDREPIYVGQTSESFSGRVSRHLTGQRSDAVAKFILDPFEVAHVAMWSLPSIAAAKNPNDPTKAASAAEKKKLLLPYEFAVYKSLEAESRFHAVLNEGLIQAVSPVPPLPAAVLGRIIPDELWDDRKHSDIRIARRAATISRLSQMISEREVSAGMRRTLRLQAQRLEWLASERIREIGIEQPDPTDDAEVEDSED